MPGISPASAVDPLAAPDHPAAAKPRAPGRATPYPGLARALAQDAMDAAKRRAREAVFASAPYRLALRGPLPDRLIVVPDALLPATLEGAQDIMRGRFSLPSGTINVQASSPFDVPAEPEVRSELHRFEWLAHLEKAGGKAAFYVAKALVEDWLDRFQTFEPFAWRGDIMGARLVAWAAHYRFLLDDNDLVFRSRLMKAMSEQARHLRRAVPLTESGVRQFEAAAALVIMGAALPTDAPKRERASEILRNATALAVLPDGGVATRSPRDQITVLAALTRVARVLADAGEPLPSFIAPVLEAMRACLALMRHGDGRLGCFNGSSEGDAGWIAELLDDAALDAGSAFAPDWRYGRLGAGRSVVLFDGGGPPTGSQATGAHAAPLSLEFSHGDQRLIVNGGVARRRGIEWTEAARRTAAHATLQIGDEDAGAILGGRAARHLGPRLYGGSTSSTIDAGEEGLWADGSHDLYRPSFGIGHRRRLFLASTGEDIRGEDSLARTGGKPSGRLDVAIRFPVHPDIRVSLAQGGDSVLLVPPAGTAWRFKAGPLGAGDSLGLEPAVYMGGETVRRNQAIVIRSQTAADNWLMRWAFTVDAPPIRARRRLV